jgi:predicted nucleic acid-binding protein
MLEVTTKPLRLGHPEIADEYTKAIQDISNLSIGLVDTNVSRIAAELRADHMLRTPDALQIAACISQGATVFITNDRRLRKVTALDVVILDDVLDL